MLAAGAAVGGLTLAGSTSAQEADAAAADHVGLGPRGSMTVEFRGRIEQSGSSGQVFKSVGFLTRATHAKRSDLFDGTPHTVSTALLTFVANGDLRARVLDQSVHSLDIVGHVAIYQRRHGGASFDDPGSFNDGRQVARYAVELQDVLAVYASGQGIPTLSGDMHQTSAQQLHAPLAGRTFGRRGARLRMFATGLGTLTNPVTLNADLEIAGNWTVE
jgi:hypothetical protein